MPRELSSKEWQDLGKVHYGRKNWAQALEAFQKSIQAGNTLDIGLLDNRAATYEKLDDLQSALKDGRKMIKTSKTDSRGYLRTGKILSKLEKHSTALEIYQYGLRHVPRSDVQFKALRGLHEKLSRQSSRPLDPFTILPVELAELVLKYLSFTNLVQCLRVSKTWCHFMKSLPSLWLTLDFTDARKAVRHATVVEYIKCSNTKVRHIMIDRLLTPEMTIARLSSCKELETLALLGLTGDANKLPDPPMTTKLRMVRYGPGLAINLDDVERILVNRASTLLHAEFHNICFRKLKHHGPDFLALETLVLKVTQNSYVAPHEDLVRLIHRAHSLKELRVSSWKAMPAVGLDFSSFDRLERLLLVDCNIRGSLTLTSTLRCLHITATDLPIDTPETHLTRLTELVITACNMPFRSLKTRLDGLLGARLELPAAELRRFSLRHDYGYLETIRSELDRLMASAYMRNLEDLTLEECPLDDHLACQIPTRYPNLKRIDVAKSRITGVAVKAIVTGLKASGLKYLGLDYCASISSDAVHWARAQGVEVSYRLESNRSSGRRIPSVR